MNPTPEPADAGTPTLGMWDVISIIVGIIVGATIYVTPASIFGNTTDQTFTVFGSVITIPAVWAVLGAWVLVGLLSLAGALCYAELATAYPTSGGDYVYLSRAYGHGPGFLFAWSEMAVIRTGASIGAMAYVFAKYANVLYPLKQHLSGTALEFLGARPDLTYATLAVLALTAINGLGFKPGKIVQNGLTLTKVIGLLAIIVAGGLYFLWPRTAEQVVPMTEKVWPFPPSFALALVFIFYAYGGWHEAAYVAAEMRNRRKNIVRALAVGVGLVTLIYLAVNLAYLAAIGKERIPYSQEIAADVMRLPLGDAGAKLISVLIAVSALGAIHGLMFTGIRLYSTLGRRERLFAWLSHKPRSLKVPPGALLVQTAFTLALLVLFETGDHWKPWVADVLTRIGIGLPENFLRKPGGFNDLVACTAPVFWLFFALTGYSVIILRSREPKVERPFRVPLYPLVPLLFCGSSLFMLYRSSTFALTQGPAEIGVVVIFLLLGVPLYALSGPPSEAKKIVQE